MTIFKFHNCRRPMIYNIDSCKSFAIQCLEPYYIIAEENFYYEIVKGFATKYQKIDELCSLEIEQYNLNKTASIVWKYRKQINDHFRD